MYVASDWTNSFSSFVGSESFNVFVISRSTLTIFSGTITPPDNWHLASSEREKEERERWAINNFDGAQTQAQHSPRQIAP